ncbi:hypothetical protein GGQ63_003993 [Prosthecomicrobium pneumaticum]|uniref:Uncharacterized protein n=1 Tax=Prosthecomicrobium pneumaticum TaxID=81895 RepID=A0A7W9L3U1_9HYPH|nr:hypothetical protein [Prosthecomicrobium pneumaticum]
MVAALNFGLRAYREPVEELPHRYLPALRRVKAAIEEILP